MKKRSIVRVPNMSEESIVEGIMKIPDEQVRAYACFVYLFGNRVSEALGMPKTRETGEYYEYTQISKKGRKIVKIPKTIIVPNEWEVEPLKAWNVQYDKETQILWCTGVPTFKTANRPVRDVWVMVKGPGEAPVAQVLWNYVKATRASKGDDSVLFDLSRYKAYKDFRKYLGVNAFPHKLRDLRATKDATVYGLDAKDLQEKFNWARPEMAMYYGRKNKSDVIAKMRKNMG